MRLFHLILIALVVIGAPLYAQEEQDISVGLVLSGGGAKGLAHIGVIEVLEDYNIRVDQVAGTSMGAIIGGFYSVGYDGHQMDSIVHRYDLESIILGDLPRGSKSIRQRKYDEKAFLKLTYRKGKLDIPAGLTDGQRIYDFLYQNTYPHNQAQHFDSLYRPYYCIAADLSTGNEVLLQQGNLATAMRASSALPTIISPVTVDDMMLVDGGIANNLPAQEMKERGLDVVICVSVEEGLSDANELVSVTDILSQVTSYAIVQKSRQQYEYCDILISPDMEGFGLLDFDAVDTIVARGRSAALQHQADLVKIGVKQQETRPYLHTSADRYDPYLRVDSIIIEADDLTTSYVRGRLPWEVGEFIDKKDLSAGINTMKGSGFFENIFYELEPTSEVGVTIHLQPQLKRNFRNSFGTALHYDNLYGIGVLIQSKTRSLLTRRDQLQADFVIGNRLRYDIMYHISRPQGFSPGLRSSYELSSATTRLDAPIFSDSTFSITEVVLDYQDFYNELNIATYELGNTLVELAAGLQYYKVDSRQLEVNDQRLTLDNTWYLTTDARYYYDDLDSRQFSMTGKRIELSAKGLYPIRINAGDAVQDLGINLDVVFKQFFPLSPSFSSGIELSAGLSLKEAHAPVLYSYASANQNLFNRWRAFPGLTPGEASGSTALYAAPFIRWRASDRWYLTAHFRSLYVGEPLTDVLTSDRLVLGTSVSAGYESVLGPLEFVAGFADGSGQAYVNLGYWF